MENVQFTLKLNEKAIFESDDLYALKENFRNKLIKDYGQSKTHNEFLTSGYIRSCFIEEHENINQLKQLCEYANNNFSRNMYKDIYTLEISKTLELN